MSLDSEFAKISQEWTKHCAKVVYTSALTSPDKSRIVDVVHGQTLADLAPRDTQLPVICQLNGEYVLRSDWNVVPTPGDLVIFCSHPLGGGGGGSNALRTILQIAVLVVVAIYQPQLLAAYGNTAGLVSAAIVIGANLLINLLIPIKPNEAGGVANNTTSSTYSTNASGNQARLDAPIPVNYGRLLVYPDFAAQPYSQYIDNDQYFFAIFCLGQGEYDIEQILIDDTDISHFVDITLYPVPLGGLPTGSPDFPISPAVVNAPEVTGQDLNQFVALGPFTSCAPGFTTKRIDIDIIADRGLYISNDDGSLATRTVSWIAEARKVNNKGATTGTWHLLGFESLSGATSTAIRKSYSYIVADARYEVRITRQDPQSDNDRIADNITWAGLRTYLNVTTSFEPTAMYHGLKMKASEQLNSITSRKFAFILKRKLKTWNPTDGWSATTAFTRNPAWAAADMLIDTVYGGKIPEERVDLQTLYDLSLEWDDRRDYFDATFDNVTTVWDALASIVKAGRTARYMRNGIFTFVRDEKQTVPRALFNGRNITKGSFNIQYITNTESSPDGITVQYWSNILWDYDYITIPSPGVDVPDNPQQLLLFGVTEIEQATREGKYLVAADRYRRRTISLNTEMDGFIPTYGDLIAVAYDLPSWGVGSGDVENYVSATKILSLSEAVTFADGSQHYVAFSTQEGGLDGPYAVSPGPDNYSLVMSVDPDIDLYFDNAQERTRFSFGPSENIYRLARVLTIQPNDINTVTLTAVIEDDRVHDADGNPTGGPGGGGGGGSNGLGRIAHYAPDGIPTYDSATTAQRNKYGFYAKDTGKVGTADDPGYNYDDS